MPMTLPESWRDAVGDELEKPYFAALEAFLAEERAHDKVFPPEDEVFTALKLTPFDDVKVVILGQDPYHGPGQAHLALPVGTTLSLLALHGPCTGVHISGVRWPLVDAELAAAVGLGVSNLSTEPDVTVRVSGGVLTVIVSETGQPAPAPAKRRRAGTTRKGAAR